MKTRFGDAPVVDEYVIGDVIFYYCQETGQIQAGNFLEFLDACKIDWQEQPNELRLTLEYRPQISAEMSYVGYLIEQCDKIRPYMLIVLGQALLFSVFFREVGGDPFDTDMIDNCRTPRRRIFPCVRRMTRI